MKGTHNGIKETPFVNRSLIVTRVEMVVEEQSSTWTVVLGSNVPLVTLMYQRAENLQTLLQVL